MWRPLYVLLLLLMTSMGAIAQKVLVKGYLRDSMTHRPIHNGTITNWKTQKSATSDTMGFFYIEATVGDLLHAKATAFKDDTLQLQSLHADTLTIFLSPAGRTLPGVTVQATMTKYQLDSMRRREDFNAIRGNLPPTINDPPEKNFGVNIGLDRLWSRSTRKKVRAEKQFQQSERQHYIEYRFSSQMVSSYTGLTGDTLQHFMKQYTPSYDWLRQHTSDQEVLLYINDKLKLFRKSSNNK